MMSLSVFAARCRFVFSIGWNCGMPPSYATSGALICFLFTVAICGICASSTASAAWSVPGTDASTRDRSCDSGICLNSAGSDSVANVHGPVKSGALNQRPEIRK